MAGIHDQEKIDQMRERLYERGTAGSKREQFTLPDEPKAVATKWAIPPEPKVADTLAESSLTANEETISSMSKSTRNTYRKKILLIGVAFFVGAVMLSSLFLFFGTNTISGDNITIEVNGPFTIGGGETLSLQVGVTNRNAVTIQSAMLVIEYPDGTKSADNPEADLYIERRPLESIRAGETINVPVKAIIFGEENEEQSISVSIEYRIEGSNATFFKEAEPLKYKVSSAPLVLQVDGVERISPDQETTIVLEATSNSQTELANILIEAVYPNSFDFVSSNPPPSGGSNKWILTSLKPGEVVTIEIRGIFIGQADDEAVIHFNAGVPQERNKDELATIFSTALHEVVIEEPFIAVELDIDGDSENVRVIDESELVNGHIVVTNTLSDTLYDTNISLSLSGNAVSDPAVSQTDGFYNSSTDQIKWDAASQDKLKELGPGESTRLSFSLRTDNNNISEPHINLKVDTESRRVSESRVPEILRATANGTIKVASTMALATEVTHESGSVPPKVESKTVYRVTFTANSEHNDVKDMAMIAILPQYVTWLDRTAGDGEITYNQTNRTITWQVSNISGDEEAQASIDIELFPSVPQVGDRPVLTEEQILTATDEYTGTVVRASHMSVNTDLGAGYDNDDGRVSE